MRQYPHAFLQNQNAEIAALADFFKLCLRLKNLIVI